MDYWYSLTVAANTPVTAPSRTVGAVAPGIVKRVWLFFPKGHRGTTKVRILRFEHQVWPTNLGEYYLGDNTVIDFPEEFPIEGYPFELVIEGYNEDDTYSHTVYVRFTILEEVEVVFPLPPAPVGVEI